jgi:protocatechuate 3,4-dioxygenase, alpha subunit
MTVATPSQTVGPFFSLGLCGRPSSELVAGGMQLWGRVLDGAGDGVPDAMVELWHRELGWGRCGTAADGRYAFTIGRVPYLQVMVFARGLLKQVLTRMYFPGEEDALLAALPAGDRATLVAEPDRDGLRFDIRLQGDRQTAFFAL